MHETENSFWNKTVISDSNPQVNFINQFRGKVIDGGVRKDIEEKNREMTIEFEKSKLNEYWICLGSKIGVVMEIKEPEYTIVDVWLSNENIWSH